MKAKWIAAVVSLGFPLFLQVADPAYGEQYPEPNKPITFISTAAPGGTNDMQIRAIGPHLSKHLGGVRIMVENSAGASGKIAFSRVYKAKSDGYTFLSYSLPAPIITELVEENVPYKTRDFVPVYAISSVPNILAVNSESTWKTLDEFIQEGRQRTVSIGMTGSKTANSLQAMAFAKAVNIKANFVPFGAGSESVATLAGRHIDAVVTATITAFPLVQAGKLRPLIVFSDEPEKTYPGVLLSKDSKWEIATFPLIAAYAGPPNLPADKVKILEGAFAKAVKEPAFIDWAKQVSLEIKPMNAARVRMITNDAFKNVTEYKSYFDK
jgi:tripartite-type tricarboxylate transporter receptor subunit TctC